MAGVDTAAANLLEQVDQHVLTVAHVDDLPRHHAFLEAIGPVIFGAFFVLRKIVKAFESGDIVAIFGALVE